MYGRSYEVNYDPEQYKKYIAGIQYLLMDCVPIVKQNDMPYDLMGGKPVSLHHKTVRYNEFCDAWDILRLIEQFQSTGRHVHFNPEQDRSVKEISHFHLLRAKTDKEK